MTDRLKITHEFFPEDASKYPDLTLRLQIRELVVRATDPKNYQRISVDQAQAILGEEAAYLESKIRKGVDTE